MPVTKSYFVVLLLLVAGIYAFAASFNFAHIHPDEYYQVVEFAAYKLGLVSAPHLSWEFREQIRPAFQPLLGYSIFKTLDFAGITDHYHHLFVLRLLSAVFTLGTFLVFMLANLPAFQPPLRKPYLLFTFLFWVPYLYGTHFSSEAWSGGFMLLAVAVYLFYTNGKIKNAMLAFGLTGLLCGLAFICRFQVAFFTVGLVLWLLFIKREKLSLLLCLVGGGVIALAIGLVCDHWLYGEWVFTPWKYFESNLIKGVASHFGVKPFYTYLVWFFTILSPVVGLVMLVSLLFFFFHFPKNMYTWILVPFLLGHSLIGHKEPRFMFPLYGFISVVAAYVYQADHNNRAWFSVSKTGGFIFWLLAGISNLVMLLVFVVFARWINTDPKTFAPDLHRIAKEQPVQLFYTESLGHPYILAADVIKQDLFPGYLREPAMRHTHLNSFCNIDKHPAQGNVLQLITTNKKQLDSDSCLQNKYQVRLRTAPAWAEPWIAKYGGAENVFYILEKKK